MGHWSYWVLDWWHQKIELSMDVFQNLRKECFYPYLLANWEREWVMDKKAGLSTEPSLIILRIKSNNSNQTTEKSFLLVIWTEFNYHSTESGKKILRNFLRSVWRTKNSNHKKIFLHRVSYEALVKIGLTTEWTFHSVIMFKKNLKGKSTTCCKGY